MIVTLALVVFCSSIVAFFSQEFIRMFKKLFSIPGVKLFLPLAIASLLIEMHEEFGFWVLTWGQLQLHRIINAVARFLPFDTGSVLLVRIVFLFCLAILPVLVFRFGVKKKGRAQPDVVSYWSGLVLWIIAVILLTVSI